MDLTSYTGLKAAIAAFVNRADLSDVIPSFIAMAEAQTNRRLRGKSHAFAIMYAAACGRTQKTGG